ELAEEGATQLFRPVSSNDLILGAVGMLQFDVVAHRLEHEYGVDVRFENVDISTARWLRGSEMELKEICNRHTLNIAKDGAGDLVYLAPNRINLNLAQERFSSISFLETRELF
ncbi:MAG: peptide chain release factor 3, partial [Pseudomonadota bacterium]|nr:peptide chain release factor 3 [Pseudomonadota bacterium]